VKEQLKQKSNQSMINLKKILSVESAVKVATLGAGDVAARYVTSNEVAGKLLKTEESMKFADAIPIAGGLILSGQSNTHLKGVGYGMIAHGAGNVIAGLIDKDGSLGLNGTPMIEGVMVENVEPSAQPTQTHAPSFSSDSSNEMAY
jgi:hypothetical protein